MSDDLKIRMPEWARHMYNRLVALINAGGGGGGEENVIEAISFNGANVPPDANKRVSMSESDPTVPSWAKQSSKPTYTAQEVGVLPDVTVYVSGVKGNAESAYRTGQVNLTAANIGAVATSNIANNLTTTAAGKVLDARQGKTLKDILDNIVLAPSTTIPIPASGSSASYNLTGLTSNYELVRWNFSASPENAPPADLRWNTYNGYFTITNSGGTTSESMRPVFVLPKAVVITSH